MKMGIKTNEDNQHCTKYFKYFILIHTATRWDNFEY